jgi:hypothetical protein
MCLGSFRSMFPLRFPVRNELGLTYAATGMGNGVRERFPILDQRAVTESPIPGDYRIHSAPSTRFRRTSHARAGKLEGGKAFVLCVRGGVDCFQCLLRSGPAAATVAPQCRIGCRLPQDHRLQGLKPDEPLASISSRDVGVPSIVFTKIGNRSLTPFPTGPGAAVTGLVGGAVGGVAVMIASFGCPVRTCTMTDGAERDVLAVGIFSGQDCYHKDPVQNPVR